MEVQTFLDVMHLAERLKDAVRHSYSSGGRRESVAEHCWRVSLMAYWLRDEFPEADMDKVIRMLLIHDLGEAFTGDIPAFEKTEAHEEAEAKALKEWVESLPEPFAAEMAELYAEMEARETVEAKIYKALDGLEALIQHNESDLSTWLPLEYDLQQVYAFDRVDFSPYLKGLRQEVLQDTLEKIGGTEGAE